MRLTRVFYWGIFLGVVVSGCTSRAEISDYPRTASYALASGKNTPLGKVITPMAKRHPGETGFQLLPNGSDSLVSRIALVEAAQKTVDLQYYSTVDDTTGKLLLQSLMRAADRGVRVRMLLDDWSLDEFKKGAAVLNEHKNIEIRVFNPYITDDQTVFAYIGNMITRPEKVTRRMHNKAIIADNEAAIMGGRNLGDEYFDASEGLNFRDMDILAAGPVTEQVSRNFDRYWNSKESYPVAALKLPDSNREEVAHMRKELAAHWSEVEASEHGKRLHRISLATLLARGQIPLTWAKAELVSDSPSKVEQPAEEAQSKPEMRLDELVNHAQQEFLIITAYFVPRQEGVEWLSALEARGVEVKVVTNSLGATDVVPVYTGYSRYRKPLVEAGVDIYEVKPDLSKPQRRPIFKASSQYGLHAKIYMVDRKEVMIGSFNLDPRSIHLNTEQVLVIHSPELGAQIAKLFDGLASPEQSYRVMRDGNGLVWVGEEEGQAMQRTSPPYAGFRRTAVSTLFSLLPVEDQL